MTDNSLTITAGLDRTPASEEGGSVRYLMAELAAELRIAPGIETAVLTTALHARRNSIL